MFYFSLWLQGGYGHQVPIAKKIVECGTLTPGNGFY